MRLPEGRPILADGAMATNLFARGLRLGDPPDLWTVTHPRDVAALHRDFIAAGADLILTNSFGGHPVRLGPFGLAQRVAELNGAAARLACAVADEVDRPVLVAGAIGPTGESELPGDAAEGFRIQARALADGGADLLWIETMSYAAEIRTAAAAAAETGLPYGLTASFGPDGRTLGGLDSEAFARLAMALPARPKLIGVNCGSGTAALLGDLAILRRTAPGLPLVAKASAGYPMMEGGQLVYPMTPADMALYAAEALASGARVIGGCCGTTAAHVAAMRDALALASASKAF